MTRYEVSKDDKSSLWYCHRRGEMRCMVEYLDKITDNFLKQLKERFRIKHYLRYMNDFILVHEDKKCLQHCLREIKKHLARQGRFEKLKVRCS